MVYTFYVREIESREAEVPGVRNAYCGKEVR
jgi:hypothetical protein